VEGSCHHIAGSANQPPIWGFVKSEYSGAVAKVYAIPQPHKRGTAGILLRCVGHERWE